MFVLHDIMTMLDPKRRAAREAAEKFERDLGYAVGPERGLHMKDDYHVQYTKNVFKGRPCVTFDWSAFDHVFL